MVWRCFVVILLGWLLANQNVSAETETKLKAAFTYNFTKYVLWPESTEQAGGEFYLCVFKSPEVASEMASISGKNVRGYQLKVKSVNALEEIDGCHLIYSDSSKYSAQIIAATANSPILTIADSRGFLEAGGIIQLLRDGRQIRFDINLQKARDVNLQISSRLLQLAREVK